MKLDRLPNEILEKIAGNLNFFERIPLGKTSEKLKKIVDAAPIFVAEVQIFENLIKIDGKNGNIDFLRKFQKNLKIGKFSADFCDFDENLKISTSRFIFVGNEHRIDKWLKILNFQFLTEIMVNATGGIGAAVRIGDFSKFRHLKILHVIRNSEISDADLLETSAVDIELNAAEISENGVANLIKKWLVEKVEKGARFVYYKSLKNPPKFATGIVEIVDTDRFLRIFVDNFSVNVECFQKK